MEIPDVSSPEELPTTIFFLLNQRYKRIIGQYVKGDEKVASFAKSNEISEGKAWIIKELAASHERQTEESLLKLSTQELLLLCNEEIEFYTPGNGIAFTVPLSSIDPDILLKHLI